jgi:hypothetical protein
MLSILAMLVALGSLICFIIVLIKLFQNEGALKGILGLICSLYTFIWGWMNSNKLGIKNIMIVWTLLIIVMICLNFLGAFNAGYPMAPRATP